MNLKDKTILITGANGLVGIPTVEKCIEAGAKKIIAADLKTNNLNNRLAKWHNVKVVEIDLTYKDKVDKLFKDDTIDIVLHLAGIKGSPVRAKNCPADYFFPMIMFNTNVIKASHEAGVQWLVYMSSVGVYAPADIMEEDSVWSTMPSTNDWYPGWAKRCGELALETLKIQYGWNKFTIIRPANIFGENDNFSPDATVIASNVHKLFNAQSNEIVCWGDGSPRRDFVFAKDVAAATVEVVEKEINDTINFGSGKAISIKETLETLVSIYNKKFGSNYHIVWDTSKPNGDLLRRLSHDKQEKYGILPKTLFQTALAETLLAYEAQK